VKLLVPVKQVARLRGGAVLDGDGRVAPADLEWGLNEWDAFSVEAALALAESDAQAPSEVVVATVGDEHAEEGLLAYLARGADRGVRIWDPSLEGADALAVAAVLAVLAVRERPDVILCGAQSSDAAGAATGIALAGLLELPHVAVVSAIEYEGGRLTVQRELDGGAVEVLRLSPPALLTVHTGANEPRHANLRAIKQARAKPLQTLGLSELELDADAVGVAAGARTVRLLERERGAGPSMLGEAPAEIAARIVEIVHERLGAR
jgi:electron transfer flavoprotein beta subunit